MNDTSFRSYSFSLQFMYTMWYKSEYIISYDSYGTAELKMCKVRSPPKIIGVIGITLLQNDRQIKFKIFSERVFQYLFNNTHSEEIGRELRPEWNKVQNWQVSSYRRKEGPEGDPPA